MLASLWEIPARLAAWRPPGLGGRTKEPSHLDRMAAGIQRGLQIQVLPNSSVIEIRYRSADPELAVAVVKFHSSRSTSIATRSSDAPMA